MEGKGKQGGNWEEKKQMTQDLGMEAGRWNQMKGSIALLGCKTTV